MFIETEWLKLLNHLGDMQTWTAQTEKDLLATIPGSGYAELTAAGYSLSAAALTGIVRRHYRLPVGQKPVTVFTVPLPEILHWMAKALQQPAQSVPGSPDFCKELNTGRFIGIGSNGGKTKVISVITNACGCVVDAFPGYCKNRTVFSRPLK